VNDCYRQRLNLDTPDRFNLCRKSLTSWSYAYPLDYFPSNVFIIIIIKNVFLLFDKHEIYLLMPWRRNLGDKLNPINCTLKVGSLKNTAMTIMIIRHTFNIKGTLRASSYVSSMATIMTSDSVGRHWKYNSDKTLFSKSYENIINYYTNKECYGLTWLK